MVKPNRTASQLLAYLSALQVSQGRRAGEPFAVQPWQARFVRSLFAQDGSGALSIARGNGKTTLLAGIAAACLNGPLARPRGEVVIVASSFEQARIAFEHVREFMGEELRHNQSWRIWDTAQQARIEHKQSGARVRCIGSDPRRAHGLAPFLILADEPSQWPQTTGERMRAALETALGKLPDSRLVALGTRPADPEHWFSKMLEGGAGYAQCHAAKADAPPFQRRTWARANPSLPHMPDLLKAIQREALQAKRDPSLLPQFEALRLNLGTADTQVAVLLEASTWKRIEGDAPRSGPCVWGIDLGTSAAQSAVACFWPASGRLECMAAFPNEPGLAERGLRDGVGGLYVACQKRGELIQCGGAATDIRALLQAGLERFGRPVALACDRWREAELRDGLQAAGIPPAALQLRGMGYMDGGADVRDFRRACVEGRVTPVPSLLLASAMSEARVQMDPAGNCKLSKGSEGGRRLRARDDAACAAILAVALGRRQAVRPVRRRLRTAIVT